MAFGRKKSKKSTKPSGHPKRPGLLTTVTDPRTVLRVVTAIRVAGPLVAAGVMRASTSVRGLLDDQRARQLGVAVEDVAAYRGPTGPARARIAGLASAVGDLRSRRSGDMSVVRFSDSALARLTDLGAAVDATASMPPGTRRATLNAVGADLDHVDAELMTFLVGPSTA